MSLFSDTAPAASRPALTLARVHLRSVGPDAARFDPLDLKHDTPAGVADKVLWSLTNTGGKTTMIRLLSSVVVTASRDQVGGTNIGEYVQTGDTAHVVTEWEHDQIGRFVLGGVYEWPDRTRPATLNMTELRRNWYMFRVGNITIDDLPFDVVGDDGTKRRRTLADFRDQMGAMFAQRSSDHYVWAREQNVWAEALDKRTPLDPELFRYQMRMNDEESGSGALVKQLSSPDSVVLFFIQALNDDQALANFATTLGEYAAIAGRRGALDNELGFFTALSEGLVDLGAAEDRRHEASLSVTAAEIAGDDMAAAVRVRVTNDRQRIGVAELREGAIRAELDQTQSEEYRNEDIRAQLILEEARLAERAAGARKTRADVDLDTATASMNAWQAVETVQSWRTAATQAEAAREAYDQAEQGLAPLRAAAHGAGADVAAKYAALAAAGDEQSRTAIEARDKAKAEAATSDAERRHWEKEHASLSGVLTQIEAQVTSARVARRELLESGVALTGEEPHATELRLGADIDALEEQIRHLREQIATVKAELGALTTPLVEARSADGRARSALVSAQAQHAAFLTELAAVAADDVVIGLAGDSALSGLEEATRIAEIAQQQATSYERDAAQFDEQLRILAAQIDRLEAGDLLATAPEIEAMRDLLREHNIGASTGWEWIAQNVAAVDREATICAHPDLANSVVVADRTRLDAAEALCRQDDRGGRIAVLVIDPGTFAARGSDGPGGFVIPPHRALFDPEWAERTLLSLRTEQAEWVDVAETSRKSASRLRVAASMLSSFVTRWQPNPREMLEAAVLACEQAAVSADIALAELIATDEALREEQQHTNALLHERSEQLGSLKVHREQARQVAGLQRAAMLAEDRRGGVMTSLTHADAERLAADERTLEAETRRSAAVNQAATARAEAQSYRNRQSRVGIEPASVTPVMALPELESRWQELGARLQAAEAGSTHAERLRETGRAASSLRSVVDELDATVRADAEQLCNTFAASNSGLRAESVRTALEAYQAATTAQARAASAWADALRMVGERSPDGRSNHIALPEEWDLSSMELIAKLRAPVEAALLTLRERGRNLGDQRTALVADLVSKRDELQRLGVALTLWRTPADNSLDAAYDEYQGSGAQAIEDLGNCEQMLRSAKDKLAIGERALLGTLDVVRNVARDERWSAVASPIRERCKTAPVEDIAVSAAQWIVDVAIRCRSLEDDLGDLDRHRGLLVDQLEQLCAAQRRLLNEVTICSRLPVGLGGELAGQPAFKIGFDKLPDAEARGRLITRVDEWASRLAGDGQVRGVNRDQRVRWLAEAVKDTVKHTQNGSWRVKVLKPPVDGRVEYRTPDRVSKEYSGGQELTLAVLLYCTLAAVRAKHRTGGSRPPGVLLIDNPFGRASNPALIRMQQMLAVQSGVQLVCATGLDDPGILSAFEGDRGRVVRLRNDRDQRRGLQYLRIADPVAAAAVSSAFGGDRTDATDEARVSANGYTVRTPR